MMMWWLVLALPNIVWAYAPIVPPVPGAVVPQAVVPQAVVTQAAVPEVPIPGAAGPCKPVVQCSVWYIELLARPQETCVSQVRGAVGLCCPDTVRITANVAKFANKAHEAPRVTMRPIALELLDGSCKSAVLDLGHMVEVEEGLARRNWMVMNQNSIAWGHSINMAPLRNAQLQGNHGLLVVSAARRLQDALSLTREEAGLGLQIYDTRSTLLKETCLPSPICLPDKFRSVDGSCNNPEYPNWGRALTPLERLLPPIYGDGVWSPRELSQYGKELPNVRFARAVLVTDEDFPAYGVTHMLMQWGQFVDHDLSHVPVFRTANASNIDCCTMEGGHIPPQFRHPHCFPIDVLPDDPFYGPRGVRCLNFVRSMVSPRADCRFGYADQLNQLTHFLDASHVYGPSEDIARRLREYAGGRLAISVINGRPFLPQDPNARGCIGRSHGATCFVSGDSRTNQIMGLTSLHTILLRQHNLIADALCAINPHWSDERLFQESRRIVSAVMQHITYNEFLAVLLGRPTMEAYGLIPQTTDYTHSYDPNVNPSITNEFSTAAYRMGHSLIQGTIQLVSEDGSVRLEQMRFWFDNPHLLRQPGVMDAVLRGLVTEWAQDMDEWVTEDVTNHLFRDPKRDFGLDLVSLNLWRGRDHGLPGYNAYRQICGMSLATTFEELLPVMEKSVVDRLALVYHSVDDIDLFVGGLVERHLPGSMLGPVFSCIIADQFSRLKEGDRFYYEHGSQINSFTPGQLQEIRRMSLAAVICDTADHIELIQPLVFRSPSPMNPRVACRSTAIPRMNLHFWKE